MTSGPVFVVVGNVNQGKSSVVAALSENETIPIDSYPGTTRRSGSYVFRAGDTELFRIVDTPGFQSPRKTLDWLRRHASTAAERPAAVAAFVAAHEGSAGFADEVELLRPLLQGAGILYVVDASSHLEPANEAEMEILRWTGQPAMALINRVRERDHAEEWRPTLRQFFHIVRDFDAHGASFADRVALLRGFREIKPEWSPAIDRAVAAMEQEWAERHRRAAAAIAELMVDALSQVVRVPLPPAADAEALGRELQERYRKEQRRLEERARQEVERIYRHPGLQRDDPDLQLLREDLFSETSWRLFGLRQGQLVRYGMGWGAALGAGIDLAVGGLSLLAGTAIGAGAGALTAWLASSQAARVWNSSNRLARSLFPGETGRFLAMGPVTSPRYAWVLLDRALVHLEAVRARSHARRDRLELPEQGAGLVATLDRPRRDELDAAMRAVLKAAVRGALGPAERQGLEQALLAVVAES